MNPAIFSQISELIQSPLLIREGALDTFMRKLSSISANKEIMPMPKATYRNNQNGDLIQDSPGNVPAVMVIPIQDVITKNSYPEHGLIGLMGIQELVQAAMLDENVLGVIFYGDSPGGTSSMLVETFDMIVALSGKKPTGFFVNGECCSALYYLAAACDFISCTPKTSLVGNIGAVSTIHDAKGFYASIGIKELSVYGDLATDKNLGIDEAFAGKPEKFRNMMVNPLNEMFVSDMKRYRKKIKEEALHGAVYYSQDALKMGLVDMTGSFEEAVSHLISKTKTQVNDNSNNSMKKITFQAHDILIPAFKLAYPDALVEDIAEGGIPPAVPTASEDKDAEIVLLKAQLETANAKLNKESEPTEDPKIAEIVLLKAQLETANADLAKRSAPGSAATIPPVAHQEAAIASNDASSNEISNLPHIVAMREQLKKYI